MLDPREAEQSTSRPGVVEEFDEHSGLGVVRGVDGLHVPFHCISIADGTRFIEAGREVTFRLEARVLRTEAVDIRPR